MGWPGLAAAAAFVLARLRLVTVKSADEAADEHLPASRQRERAAHRAQVQLDRLQLHQVSERSGHRGLMALTVHRDHRTLAASEPEGRGW